MLEAVRFPRGSFCRFYPNWQLRPYIRPRPSPSRQKQSQTNLGDASIDSPNAALAMRIANQALLGLKISVPPRTTTPMNPKAYGNDTSAIKPITRPTNAT